MALILFMSFVIFNIEFILVYYLVFIVCERILGLGLIVILIRFRDSDIYYMFNIRKF